VTLHYAEAGEPDARGYNLSSKPAEPELYRMRHLLGDANGLVDHLGGGPFTLVGHDWGGIVAYGLERWVPDVRVELLSGAGHWTPQECPAEVSRLIREFVDSG